MCYPWFSFDAIHLHVRQCFDRRSERNTDISSWSKETLPPSFRCGPGHLVINNSTVLQVAHRRQPTEEGYNSHRQTGRATGHREGGEASSARRKGAVRKVPQQRESLHGRRGWAKGSGAYSIRRLGAQRTMHWFLTFVKAPSCCTGEMSVNKPFLSDVRMCFHKNCDKIDDIGFVFLALQRKASGIDQKGSLV